MNDSFLHEYAFEHYKPLIKSGGVWLVGSYRALDHALSRYLEQPTIHAEGRSAIRDEHISPLDGNASRRLIDYLIDTASKARANVLPAGDWSYQGLGDTSWATRQTCELDECIQF